MIKTEQNMIRLDILIVYVKLVINQNSRVTIVKDKLNSSHQSIFNCEILTILYLFVYSELVAIYSYCESRNGSQ